MLIDAYVVHEPGGPYQLEKVELDEPRAGEVLVRIAATGICMTDEAARFGHVPTPFPLVAGHEGAGVVEAVGPEVTGLAVGDHVVITYAHDGSCPACADGEPYYCEHFNDINFGGVAASGGTRLHQGADDVSMFFGQSSFATHAVVSASSCAKVPASVDLALVAPLGCGIQTGAGMVLSVAAATPDTRIAVFGCGAVGMSAIMAAHMAGCAEVIAVGGNAKTLELAAELGATRTVNRHDVANIADAIIETTSGGADVAIDTSGAPALITSALRCLKYRGLLLPVGAAKIDEFELGLDVILPMRTIKATSEGESHPKKFLPKLIGAVQDGSFPLGRIVSFYAFDELERAIDDIRNGRVIKAVLRVE